MNGKKRKINPMKTRAILIVCEGEKAEPNYFKLFKKEIINKEYMK